MRTWPGFVAPDFLRDHVIRYLPRDYPLFARLNPGDQYPQAWQHALDMLEERVGEVKRQGTVIRPGTAAWQKLKSSIVPPYDATKFPNKWRKMWRDQPARTLMAHFGKDSYSHIHYDRDQARTISVREAARLQSFPDGFCVFCGTTMNTRPAARSRQRCASSSRESACHNHTSDAASGVRKRNTFMSVEERAASSLRRKSAVCLPGNSSSLIPGVAENFGFSKQRPRHRGRYLFATCTNNLPRPTPRNPDRRSVARPSLSSCFSACSLSRRRMTFILPSSWIMKRARLTAAWSSCAREVEERKTLP